jgi:pimeloyl-ACP methyl ester carboxylesterase
MFAIALWFAIRADTVLYQANGHLYSIAKTDGSALLLLEYDTGRLSRLREGGDGYVAGPTIGAETPVAVRVVADDDTLTIDRGTEHIVAKRANPFLTENLPLGTLYVPTTAGKHTLLIAVPGAGSSTRRAMALQAPYFARRSIAVLALDKRSNWETATFDDIAADVADAVRTMSKRGDIGRIGLYASSQGGWIAPLAAAKAPAVAFVVCTACPMTTMPEQELIRTAHELRADGYTDAEVKYAVAYRRQLFQYLHDGTGRAQLERLDDESKNSRWYVRFGGVPAREAALAQWWRMNDSFDPAAAWRNVRVPSLMLYGERDTRVPPKEHARLVTNAHSKVVIVPQIDHEGLVAVTGGSAEVPLLDRMPVRAMESTIDWILGR